MIDRLELALRALPFEAREALEIRWEQEGAPQPRRLEEAEALAAEARHDGCGWG